jgi:hypothetical protein
MYLIIPRMKLPTSGPTSTASIFAVASPKAERQSPSPTSSTASYPPKSLSSPNYSRLPIYRQNATVRAVNSNREDYGDDSDEEVPRPPSPSVVPRASASTVAVVVDDGELPGSSGATWTQPPAPEFSMAEISAMLLDDKYVGQSILIMIVFYFYFF